MDCPNKLEKIKDIYGQYWHDLCGFVRGKFGGGPPDPEDVAQATFLKYADVEDHSAISNPKAFLFATARNMVVDYHRSPKNYQPSQDQIDAQEKNEKSSDVFNPETVFMGKQEANIVESVIMQLSERDRAFVLMNRLEGMTYTEIAKQANMSRSGVQKIITQALAKCMSELERHNLA